MDFYKIRILRREWGFYPVQFTTTVENISIDVKIFWYIYVNWFGCNALCVHWQMTVQYRIEFWKSKYVNSVMLGQASCQRCQNILFKVFQRLEERECPGSISLQSPSTYQTRPVCNPPSRYYISSFLSVSTIKVKPKCLWIRKKWDRSNRNWSNNFYGTYYF